MTVSGMTDNTETPERLILVAAAPESMEEAQASLDELEQLTETAGGVCLEKMIQPRDRVDPATYIGSGKIAELRERIRELRATGIVCDDELTPAQMKNLENALDVKVLDRTLVILDIFASRASSREGKIQVELAQLRYRATRLVGMRDELSRLGGGIGTRGPGETKLESDRRVIHRRIGVLKAELEDVKRHREVTRKQRERNHLPVAAIVGYTNAGKSTLLNALTGSDILAEDKLFATLDPTTRNFRLPDGEEILLTDTVGFIRKLPHNLVDAFRSTLEEAKYADVILHVVDASSPQMEQQMETVYRTLRDLGTGGQPVITLFNKTDRENVPARLSDPRADDFLRISAKHGTGLDELGIVLENILRERRIYVEKVIPYEDAGKVQLIRRTGQLTGIRYEEDGIHVEAYVPPGTAGKL